MFNLDNLLEQYLKIIEPDNNDLSEYFKAYRFIVDKFGYEPIIQPGQIQLLGWDLEYRSIGATLPNFIDQILIRRLNDFIPDNDRPLILDCGANIGFSSLSYKRQSPNARIIAFEPDPEFVPLLRRNLERNSAGDVEVVDAAVWVENGISQWYCEGIDGSHLSTETGETVKTTTVRTVDLGDYLNEPVDLIKMDIEGTEYDVINHVGEKLKFVKAMSIECHLDQKKIVPFGKMLGILSAAGFQLSINSFGPWRDLIHQPPVLADHHENYILVSAWRGLTPSAPTRASWVPGIGVAPILDYANHIRYIIQQASAPLDILKSYALRGEKALKRVVLNRPYQKEIGFSWAIRLEDLKLSADDGEHLTRSALLLYEDDELLQPAHAMHDDIRNLGAGRYSHWNEELYFSTSDGSDPNTNGRVYRIIYCV
jgi:FkbM family methyltransferase